MTWGLYHQDFVANFLRTFVPKSNDYVVTYIPGGPNQPCRLKYVRKDGTDDGSRQLQVQAFLCTLPGQCGVMLVHDWVGAGESFERLAEYVDLLNSIGRVCGYTKLMITYRTAYMKVFTDLGFTPMISFTNKRTENNVTILLKDIT